MSRALQWILGIAAVVLVAAIVFSAVWPLFAGRAGWGGNYGWMGPGHMFGGGMMGGYGFGLPVFGFGILLWPLLFIGLPVLGVVWLVRSVAGSGAQSPGATVACAHCGRALQTGWKVCPYCGERV